MFVFEIFDLKNDDEKVKMWLGEGVDVDYDEIKKGVNVKVDAVADDEGDWVITKISLIKPKGGKGKGSKSKTKTKQSGKGKGKGSKGKGSKKK